VSERAAADYASATAYESSGALRCGWTEQFWTFRTVLLFRTARVRSRTVIQTLAHAARSLVGSSLPPDGFVTATIIASLDLSIDRVHHGSCATAEHQGIVSDSNRWLEPRENAVMRDSVAAELTVSDRFPDVEGAVMFRQSAASRSWRRGFHWRTDSPRDRTNVLTM
jgi:hypothetical protein